MQFSHAQESLVILTSMPKSYMTPFIKEYRRQHPNVEVNVINKKTPSSLRYILSGREPKADVFIASSLDAFEYLKTYEKLLLIDTYSTHKSSVIRKTNNKQFYQEIAYSGFGVMWNNDYLNREKMDAPRDLFDLIDFKYFNHIAISSPSRSGTTHMMVESILQQLGWKDGWAYLLQLAGNLKTITARSFGVRDYVANGDVGIGLVIDFFAFTMKQNGKNVDFIYRPELNFIPANAALIQGGRNVEQAKSYIDFLISEEGQKLLGHKDVMRIPIALRGTDAMQKNSIDRDIILQGLDKFDSQISSKRYHMVNVVFEELIQKRTQELKEFWQYWNTLELRLEICHKGYNKHLLLDPKRLMTSIPIDQSMADESTLLNRFVTPVPGKPKGALQVRLEKEWSAYGSKNFKKAMEMLNVIDARFHEC